MNNNESLEENNTNDVYSDNIGDKEKSNQFAGWFSKSQSRRDNIGTLAALGFGAAAFGLINNSCDESEEDEIEIESDALELQKEEGWNFGSDSKTLNYNNQKIITDPNKISEFNAFSNPSDLLSAYQPKNLNNAAYLVPTLIQSTSSKTLAQQLKIFTNSDIDNAYSSGLGMREIIKGAKNPEQTLYIVDANGPESVAFGAALSDVADLVPTFDNWPHPIGVVPSHLTLSTLIRFAKEVRDNSSKRPEKAPAVFLLDRRRFIEKISPDIEFDNRYVAKIPTLDNLKSLKIDNIIYIVPNRGVTLELDDLNDDFTYFKENGISIQILPLTDFFKDDEELAQNNTNRSYSHSGYPVHYYGGSPLFHSYFFFSNYSYLQSASRNSYRNAPQRNITPPSYAPSKRTTIFSNRAVSSMSGIGKSRPSGFGSVTTRTSVSSGRVTGLRAGGFGSFGSSRSSGGSRSGSIGRSGGRSGG